MSSWALSLRRLSWRSFSGDLLAGLHKTDLDAWFPRVDEIPFTSETKRMTTLHAGPAGTVAYSKGAAEVVLDCCARQCPP